jgi:hypothetical protein
MTEQFSSLVAGRGIMLLLESKRERVMVEYDFLQENGIEPNSNFFFCSGNQGRQRSERDGKLLDTSEICR